MAFPYNSIVQAKPFKFFVGLEKSEFYIHPPVLSRYSKPLHALMHTPMKESKEESAWLREVDEATFARFAEFLYTGDYPAAPHSIVITSQSADLSTTVSEQNSADAEPSSVIDRDAAQPVEDHDEGTAWSSKIGRKSKKRTKTATRSQGAWEQFLNSRCELLVDWTPYTSRPNEEPCEEYTDVLLCHAKLYVLADTYDVERLRMLSLNKLHSTLCAFTLYRERTEDISRVLEYTYDHTSERDGNVDDMRVVMIEYIACKLEAFVHDPRFAELIKGSNSISFDLMRQLLARLD
ncbi:hypothetical protein CBER1_11888 [Cercospora berteroae]|uniref:BTB domain-containing protein n=1 Tax=Cercospora berteroae TaxID=357750 RepID=A0A2S6C0I5_9PEZI|nr:hypothetical protein CBER1_11888 [Cercospora berteroae]